MSGSRLISAFGLVAIFCEISVIVSANYVPAIILYGHPSDTELSINAFQKTSGSEFIDILSNKVGGSRSPIVIFSKENLCVEDLSKQKLKITNDLVYLPAVDSPLSALENLDSYNISKNEKPESISDGQVIIVEFTDFNVITEMIKTLKGSSPDAVFVITGASCSYSRSERTRRAAVTPRAHADEVVTQSGRVLLFVREGIYAKAASEETFTLLGQPTSATTESNGTDSVRFDLSFTNNTLRLNFTATATKYWYLNNIDYVVNDVVTTLTTDTKIFFPFNFSYHCARDAVFYYNTTYVNLTGFQVQIDPKQSTLNETLKFSDGYDCVGFTTIPIWSGIFTTALLALIFIWGITMVMDIRTMDRFDDPKGKTITITATE